MRRQVLTAIVGALAVALCVAGCGGAAEGTTVAPLAKPTFVKRADAICEKSYERVKSGYESFTGKATGEPFSNIDEIEAYADTVLIPAKWREVEELRGLGAPSGDEGQVEAIVAAYEVGIEKAEESARDAVTSTSGVFVKATELAQDYGLESCRH